MSRIDAHCGEARLEDLLSDPIVQLLMRRDGVSRHQIEELIGTLKRDGNRAGLTSTEPLTVARKLAPVGRI